MREYTKKDFKEKVKWFITNKNKMSRQRREWALAGMDERYIDFIPYNKYGRYGDGMVEYINAQIVKKMEKMQNKNKGK
jgi:protein tyrosine phosphatase